LRGEHRLAISRLRDALALDPTLSNALVELGAALYAVGDVQESTQAYELALALDPRSRASLEGLARGSVAANRYDQAAESLHKLLRLYPRDVAAWLYLGDVEMRRGDELAARDYYTKASTIDPNAEDVISRARQRLANMDLVRAQAGRLAELQEAKHP
jgi:tetratricopeptide (TPR) repeat protein